MSQGKDMLSHKKYLYQRTEKGPPKIRANKYKNTKPNTK